MEQFIWQAAQIIAVLAFFLSMVAFLVIGARKVIKEESTKSDTAADTFLNGLIGMFFGMVFWGLAVMLFFGVGTVFLMSVSAVIKAIVGGA